MQISADKWVEITIYASGCVFAFGGLAAYLKKMGTDLTQHMQQDEAQQREITIKLDGIGEKLTGLHVEMTGRMSSLEQAMRDHDSRARDTREDVRAIQAQLAERAHL